MATREEAVRLAREWMDFSVLPGTRLSHDETTTLARAYLALDERVRVLEALLGDLHDVEPDATFGSVIVRRMDVPALFGDDDGGAMYLADAINKALATGEGKEG